MVKKRRPNPPGSACHLEANYTVKPEAVESTQELVPTAVIIGSSSAAAATNGGAQTVVERAGTPSDTRPVPETEEPGAEDKNDRVPVFKDPSFVHSNKTGQTSKKTRVWKNLKQIITAERSLTLGPDDVIYATIDAPPSFFPAKKYSDISGLPAKYTDPQTKVRYATAEEFSRIRMLPADLVAGYLAIRKANTPVP